jgi:hypothetical protein
MGSKRVGLARVQALIENLKRELDLQDTTLKNADTLGTMTPLAAAHGAGVIGTEIAPKHYRYQAPDGTLINTIELDLTGLKHSNVLGDAIGLDAGAAYVTKYLTGYFIKLRLSVLNYQLPHPIHAWILIYFQLRLLIKFLTTKLVMKVTLRLFSQWVATLR